MFRAFVLTAAAAGAIAGASIAISPMAVANVPYKNCSEARANGDTDIPSTSEYYGEHLDRDLDGIGCES
ncbi:calcium-binding protein [Mycobacterium sp. GA-1285]|uniref:excalibur calcium-binding domain-containing protein n=1 Tax=Mycobacterium sp. GA-1285 TaxID=1772282 RepID=UPI0007465A1F|nr:excalibur calcium-binding domain-containing protein [Mycobacterium sp. GA-1285]KUI16938.1 calcium-binding protein [Mycobacterium sp. GA-1285]